MHVYTWHEAVHSAICCGSLCLRCGLQCVSHLGNQSSCKKCVPVQYTFHSLEARAHVSPCAWSRVLRGKSSSPLLQAMEQPNGAEHCETSQPLSHNNRKTRYMLLQARLRDAVYVLAGLQGSQSGVSCSLPPQSAALCKKRLESLLLMTVISDNT